VRADLRMGISLANLMRPHLKPGSNPSPLDFMPFIDKKPPAPADERELGNKILQAFIDRGK